MTSGDMLESLSLVRVRLRGDGAEAAASVFPTYSLLKGHSMQHSQQSLGLTAHARAANPSLIYTTGLKSLLPSPPETPSLTSEYPKVPDTSIPPLGTQVPPVSS